MIPILYEATEKEFTSQGLGCLTDTISCKVTEERNGSFELEMEYPIGGIHYADIAYNRIVTAVPADGEKPQPFEIYRITRPLNGKVTVYGQHISYRLSYTVTLPTTKVDNAADALRSLKSNSVTDCPFTFETDVVKAGSFYNPKVQSIRSILGGQTGSILDCFGGEYKWDKWTVKLCDSRGSTLPVTLEYGKNLTDLQQEENIENTYTAVICTWTSSDQDNPVHVNGDIVYTDNWKSFPYVRTLVVDKSSDYQNQPTKENLTNDAKNYISTNGVGIPKVSVKVSFINLADTEEYKHIAPLQHINLCDTIRVRFAKLGVNASAKVIKTVYDVLGEKYTSLEIGDSRTSLVSTTASVSQEIEDTGKNLTAAFRSELKKQTDLITGGKGGYVVIRRDEDTGYPDEILIMDQPDKMTAKNVIRMNKNGIGFSQNGYDGPFNSAWTINGVFNADYIGAGTITAITFQTAKPEEGVERVAIEKDTSAIKGLTGTGHLINIIDMMNGADKNDDAANMVLDCKNLLAIRSPKIGVVARSYGTGEADVKQCITGTSQYVTSVEKNMNFGSGEQGTHEGYVFDGAVFCTLPVYLDVRTSGINYINGMVVTQNESHTYTI